MEKEKPMASFRHGGEKRAVEAAVWRNQSESGREFLNVTIKAQYRDGDAWKDTSSFGLWDLYSLSRCVTDALAYVTHASLKREEPAKAA